MTDAVAARPKHTVGEVVEYFDHHNRLIAGEIINIEATWNRWNASEPLIQYTLRHPTYRNKRCYQSESYVR